MQLPSSNDRCPSADRVRPSHGDDILLIDVLEGVSHAAETELGNKGRHGGACLPGES